MDDLDPAAPPSGEAIDPVAIQLSNFGEGGQGDLPPGAMPSEEDRPAAIITIPFTIQNAERFLTACETSHPRVTYGLGKKVAFNAVPGVDFTAVDCSGFVREAVRRSTNLGNNFPDGSVVQHDWVANKGFARDNVPSGSLRDNVVRIAFLSPNATTSGIGHVVLIHNGMTLESHGGVGPDSRPFNGNGWQALTTVFVLSGPVT
ncbi:hypothetical protein SAMN05444161_1066 [Rhizobiales bacterium GAS191]|jgi:hypothetical protein|nr:hypothetical protein SAMN05444161_1066 [Rhizobiales bacterium GAS191]SEC85789.1 hypothetical protein SAMN05519104_2234 [Rhizobiales bacterium GAS188]